ncbi:hypothetical protein OROMI_004456 [Orobanche minor]
MDNINSSLFDAAAAAEQKTLSSAFHNLQLMCNQRSSRKRNVEDKDKSSVSCNPRRSRRLMLKSAADHSINQLPAPAPAPVPAAPAPENRKKKSEVPGDIGPAKLNLSKLLPFKNEKLVGCATLILQDHSLQYNQNWHDWRILKIVEAVRAKHSEKRDKNGVGKTTFEGHLLSTPCHRRVNGIRTLKPYTKWYRGKLWVPLIRPLPKPDHYTRGADELSVKVVQELKLWYKGGDDTIPLVPPERHGCDIRSRYKPFSDKRAGTDEEIITPGTDPVYLDLDKFSDSDFGFLKDCATLAMHDHLIQIGTKKWRDWCLEIVEARREGLGGVAGYNYYLTFQAHCYGKDERTLEAEVWDGKAQRRVNRFRAIMPRTTYCVPRQVMDLFKLGAISSSRKN